MMTHPGKQAAINEQLSLAIQNETEKFREYYLWLEKAMPPAFFEDVSHENILLIVHNLIGFNLQDYFTTIHLRGAAIVICLDSADADLRILKNYAMHGIKNYQAYVSTAPPPFPGVKAHLRIAQTFFTQAIECIEESFPEKSKEELRALVKQRNPNVTDSEFEKIINSINIRFLRSLTIDRLILALDMFFRAKTRDNCQYEVRYNENWEEKGIASMQVVLAWRNTPKHNFLYRMARIIHRYNLVMKKVNAAYIDPYSKRSILVMALGLHGSNGKAVWDVADIPDFLRELATTKYFASFDPIDSLLIKTGIIVGKLGNFLRSAVNFAHQALVHIDPNLYTLEHIELDLCRHPELTSQICRAFELKFDPDYCDYQKYLEVRDQCLVDIENLDTGHPGNDERRKNVLKQALNLIHYSLKTNYYRLNYTAASFRLDPKYLDDIPFNRKEKFPELPYGIFYMKGMHFFGFHIRFKDLSRGGLRTVYTKQPEHLFSERNTVFSECYNLAYTQQKKNKDIPEGGSKAIIFLQPFERMESEAAILKNELEESGIDPKEIENKLQSFRDEQSTEFLYQAQRAFIESLITIVNCDPSGEIRAKNIVDYWKRPEYIYLGPDENMHDSMIQWISSFSQKYDYKPGSAFISGKPQVGINHKEYGVTSLGVNVYMHKLLLHLGIDPEKDPFTIKISGGPDGDVAGNQIRNLHKHYPNTAKLVALTDVSGTISDPEGLDLSILVELFHQCKPIKYYPPEKLHEGGFLVDKEAKKQQTAFVQQTLCWKMKNGSLIEEWLSGSEMNHLFRNNVHQTKSDIFIPAGGRPRTLNHQNVKDFLDAEGNPTSKGIVEGANLYLTSEARRFLEEKGVLIIKDSSANKTGVICSSFEVLCGLVLPDHLFLKWKSTLIEEILERLKLCASNEADLLLNTLKTNRAFLTEISDKISARINQYTYELLDFLEEVPLSNHPSDPLIKYFLDYALPSLVSEFQEELLEEVPDHHKKAIISSHIAAQLVYKKGLDWRPSIVDILPVILEKQI
ncbi:NAD-glutamate dehydrogenase domain-containing protein [Waddlia chondrophila]|nr:NAD-glutamate dehydrogenase domain-containing protein [Waddlia chondrophila]